MLPWNAAVKVVESFNRIGRPGFALTALAIIASAAVLMVKL